jgi:hypothetical protein
MTLLTSAVTGAGSGTGLRRLRRRFLILAIRSGADFGCLRGLPSFFLLWHHLAEVIGKSGTLRASATKSIS